MTEFMPENGVIIAETADESPGSTAQNDNALVAAPKPPTDVAKKKKKRGIFGIFKAALFLLRHRRPVEKWAKKTVTKETTDKSSSSAHWKKLVGSMRPLRLPEAALSPPPALNDIEEMIPPPQEQPPPVIESIEEIKAASPEVSHSGTMSQYASATSLRDLDVSDDEEEGEEEDPDEVFDAITGDEMIDAKAEEFIAQFYRQIHLQNTKTSATHHHHHRHTRI